MVALRNPFRHRGYAFIFLAGLVAGLAICLLLIPCVRNELGLDQPDPGRSYQAQMILRQPIAIAGSDLPRILARHR